VGEQAGSKETTLSLGILHDDDPRERRWALKFDDPKVLARINSVYVTAESASKQSDAPRGPRVLYAYFGAEPNHPEQLLSSIAWRRWSLCMVTGAARRQHLCKSPIRETQKKCRGLINFVFDACIQEHTVTRTYL